MINVPVTVTTYSIDVSVTNDVVTVDITATPIVIDVSVSYGIPDAPSDGKQYARKDKSWIEVALTPTDIKHNSTTERDAEAAHPASSITYGDGTVEDVLNSRFLSIVEGDNIEIDNTDPQNPVIALKSTPEVTDLNITNLNSNAVQGGVIPADKFTWLGATAKSVLSFIAKLVDKTYDLATRVGVLETKIIADYTLPQNESVSTYPEISVTGFTIPQGQDFLLHIYFPALPNNAAQASINVRFNVVDTDATKYYTAAADGNSFTLITGASEGSFIMTFRWVGNKAEGMLSSYRITRGTRTIVSSVAGTNNSWLTAVTSVIIRTTQVVTWPAGTRIIIKKM